MSVPASNAGPVLGCIADDFTGATDLANNLVRSGFRTVQTIGIPDDGEDDDVSIDADAIVVALKSRTIPANDAVEQSLSALHWLQRRGVEQFYFKYCSTFDSTPAGNIGPVTDALLDVLDADFTIACPAFPANGRTVFNGHLFVGDRLLSESGMRHHPLTPMTDADLVRVLSPQTRHRVGLVAHDVVSRGSEAIRERFAQLVADGVRIAVVDAIRDEDLLAIGRAARGLGLVTGGSGVAMGLPQNWPDRGHVGDADRLPPATGRRAIVSGSCSEATNAQVAAFRREGGAAHAIDPLVVAANQGAVDDALAWCAQHVGAAPVLVYATAESAKVRAVQEELGTAAAGALVEHALSSVARGLVERGVRQLIVAGGETSGAVVQALGIRRMTIGPQIDPGVPWTACSSPLAPGDTLHVALKSGNFGSSDFFTKAFDRLAPR